jgi:hypothetical protein
MDDATVDAAASLGGSTRRPGSRSEQITFCGGSVRYFRTLTVTCVKCLRTRVAEGVSSNESG